MSNLRLVNTTCLFSAGCTLNLADLLVNMRFARFPKDKDKSLSKFTSLVVKRKNCTALIYSSGKIVLTGAKSIVGGKETAKRMIKQFQIMGLSASLNDFKVTNLVGALRLSSPIDMRAFCSTVGGSLEPELFPGLIYKIKNRASVTCFCNGKAYITGCKNMRELKTCADDFVLLTATFLK